MSAALFLFAFSADFPRFESAISELSAIVDLNPEADNYGEIGEFELTYGESAKAASESVYETIKDLGFEVIASHKMPIDPTGIFIHDLK